MKSTTLAACSPLLMLLLSGVAQAAIEPFTVGASETISHDNNVNRTSSGEKSSWITATELRAALDQEIGRDRLTASLAGDYNTYSSDSHRNSLGYRGAAEFAWTAAGDLSGAVGGRSLRRQYLYGIEGVANGTSTRNLETTNEGYANIELGGLARWNLFAGFDAMNRRYSNRQFSVNDERQWSTNVGTRYSTSPDLSFGISGNYTHGQYPNYRNADGFSFSQAFESRSVSATTRLQASGNSAFDASVGYTRQSYDRPPIGDAQPDLNFVNGSLNWHWTPPSRFSVRLGLSRSANGGATAGSLSALSERSINNAASLGVTYELTGKVSLVGNLDYIQRKYNGAPIPIIESDGTITVGTASGTNHSQRFALYAHYKPTRITDLNCGASHESLTAGARIRSVTPNYTDTTYLCSASIDFN